MKKTVAPLFALVATLLPHGVLAESTPAGETLERLKAEKELLEAKSDVAQARIDYANVLLDLLPGYTGVTEADSGTGKFETTVLSARALDNAASAIAKRIPSGSGAVLVLSGEEQFQFGAALDLGFELRRMRQRLPVNIGCIADCGKSGPDKIFGLDATGAVNAALALAGMLRSETSITTLSADAIDSRMLAAAVAAKVSGRESGSRMAFVRAGHPGIRIDANSATGLDVDEDAWIGNSRIGDKFLWLMMARAKAKLLHKSLTGARQTRADRTASTAIANWISEFDEFQARVARPGENGAPSPIAAAIASTDIESRIDHVVRVEIEAAGGSLKNSRNIGTFVGVDPLRVSGGVVASYVVFDTRAGQLGNVTGWGVISCASKDMRIRRVARARFADSAAGPRTPNLCQ